jgi:predicted nucleic acid-binding protein
MAHEVFWDTSGFFALLNSDDAAHDRVSTWLGESKPHRPVTTEWVIGETLTLLVARRKPHLVGRFLDSIANSESMLVANPDEMLLGEAKDFIRKHAPMGFSFTDCISFCLMKERRIKEALTTDSHFRQAGFVPLLSG